jgi:polyferredoxin
MVEKPTPRFDLLHAPLVGRVLCWRWGRLILQIPLLILAGLIIYDGLTGPQLAPENIATVSAWIHYRGMVMLALLLVGNLFCMACPFTLPRTMAQKISGRGRRWPRPLRNKWFAIALLFLIFFLYEWLDLWASPWLTAWLAITYFVAAFALEAIFAESPFCKYLCPLGSFNYVASAISPTQITVRSQDVCRICEGKECVNGSSTILGCGTELFAPRIESNLDCTLCLDCARACPYDNVVWGTRPPLRELTAGSWPQRWDVAFLALVFVAASLSNAFGMVPPVYALLAWMSTWLPIQSEAVALLLLLAVLNLALPATVGLGVAGLSRSLAGGTESLRLVFTRYTPALIPLAVAIWLAHYGFHFVTGALSIAPVTQLFLLDHGFGLLGSPNWALGPILPFSWLLPLQILVVTVGLLATLYVLGERVQVQQFAAGTMAKALLPWALLAITIAITAIYLFTLPMEMRGTVGLGH